MSSTQDRIRRELFDRLAQAKSWEERQALIAEAVGSGIDLAEMEAWLDCLENRPNGDRRCPQDGPSD